MSATTIPTALGGQAESERKKQLRAISDARCGRDILVFAADLNKDTPLTAISCVDILPITDLFSNLKGKALDLILETPGESGEVAEDIVRLLRSLLIADDFGLGKTIEAGLVVVGTTGGGARPTQKERSFA